VFASPKTYRGTSTQTTTERSTVPIDATAQDQYGQSYQVQGDVTVTTTTQREASYDVDYEDLTLLVQQEKPGGLGDTLKVLDRKTLCPAVFGVCVGNRHPYERLLEDGVKWMIKSHPQRIVE
jgi:hypothetical protein